MKSVGYWVPQDALQGQHAHLHHFARQPRGAKKNWADFQADPEWKKVSAESQVDGPIVSKVGVGVHGCDGLLADQIVGIGEWGVGSGVESICASP
jgi:hypothetical protein